MPSEGSTGDGAMPQYRTASSSPFFARIETAFGFARADGAQQAPGNTIDPALLQRWNLGAFALAPFWALSHGAKLFGVISLLCWATPLWPLGVLVAVALGVYGNRLAAKNRTFASQEDFLRTQTIWARWGVGVLVLAAVFIAFQIASSNA